MKTFLLVTGGVVVGLLVVVSIGWLWLRRKLRGIGEALGALVTDLAGAVPPFRISLVPSSRPEWSDPARVLCVSGGFEGEGYQAVGDFEVPEMEGVVLRGFWHPRQHGFAVIYDHPQAGICVDLVALFSDRTLLTVSHSPETGMDRPERSRLVRMQVDLDEPAGAAALHERLVQESAGREPIAVRADHFVRTFTGAYQLEQDWRIARGGVTPDEIRRAAELGGQEPPDDCAVELVQGLWRVAISEFVEQAVLTAYQAGNPMPASEWEGLRDRIQVVHEHVDRDDLADTLAWALIAGSYDEEDDEAEDRLHAEAKQRLAPLFGGSICAGFAEAQSLLPEKGRYRKLGSVAQPWVGDLYRAPDEESVV